MYMNTPTASGQAGAQPPSTPTRAPRMGPRDLPPSPHPQASPMFPGVYAPYAMPYQAGHTVAYGLMTPPDSPDKPSGRGLDFHPALDARSPYKMRFDMRQGMVITSDQLGLQAVNHPLRLLRITIGPVCIDIANDRGMVPTVQDVASALAKALRQGVLRGSNLDAYPYFGGLTLRTVEGAVGMVDCHLQAPRSWLYEEQNAPYPSGRELIVSLPHVSRWRR